MKQTKSFKINKIVVIILMVTTILGLFVITPSAQTDDTVIERGFYVFNETLTFEYLFPEHEEYFNFTSGGFECDVFYISSPSFIEYWTIDGSTHQVYSSSTGWVSEDYQLIFVREDANSLSAEFVQWFDANTSSVSPESAAKKGMYKDIEQILTSTIYDAEFIQLDSFQRMTVTLLSTIACVAVVALPVIVCFWLVKFIFSLFKYF